MEIQTITYKRIKNLGNFQSETIEMTALLDQYDDPSEVSQRLKELVNNQLFPSTAVSVATETDSF